MEAAALARARVPDALAAARSLRELSPSLPRFVPKFGRVRELFNGDSADPHPPSPTRP
ncbi:MAG: hypothetical protein U0Y82_13095 [Thermoleophilia bacterium]